MKKVASPRPSASPAPNVTIRDVARKAGVCIGTVSRVLNNKDRVDPRTRARIQKLMKKMGYQPSALGRNLALRRTHAIQLGVFNIADPYCAKLLKEVAWHCHARGYSTLLGDADHKPALEADHLRRLLDGRVDGAIITPVPTTENVPCYAQLVAADFPFVLMDNHVPGIRANCVKYDDLGGATKAMDYLFAKGHSRIAFLGCNLRFQTVKDRYAAYVRSHQARGIRGWEAWALVRPEGFAECEVAEHLARVLSRPEPVTAILAENELMAFACIHTLHGLGKKVPQEVAVLSFGGAGDAALKPMPLTSISLRPEKAAEEAVRLLLELLENTEARRISPRTVIVEPELIPGQSA